MIVELIEILTPNIMALLLLIGMVRISRNVVAASSLDSTHLKLFIFLQIAVILLDILNRTIEGFSGMAARTIVIVSNYLLFLCDVLLASTFVIFIMGHVYGYIQKGLRIVILISLGLSVSLLIINCFEPIVFYIDSSNYYSNGSLYFVFVAAIFMIIPAAIVTYYVDKNRRGSLEFFSPTLFLLPIIIGEVLSELCIDKVSTILPMFTVSAVLMFFSLLHEALYRDKLTGIYNRFYLDQIIMKKRRLKKDKKVKTALMMDLNHFKSINDSFGHEEGDVALKNTGDLLANSVIGRGKAIRYAGDEFIVILDTSDVSEVENYITMLKKNFELFNQQSKKDYKLSISIGYDIFDPSVQTLDKLMMSIDQKMYDDKKAFYEIHSELNRRK